MSNQIHITVDPAVSSTNKGAAVRMAFLEEVEETGGVKSIILASDSEDCWGPYDSWSDFTGKVNWCLTNCVGPWRIAPLTAERTTYHNVGSIDHHDEVQAPVFAFDLADDAVLFHLKFGGTQ